MLTRGGDRRVAETSNLFMLEFPWEGLTRCMPPIFTKTQRASVAPAGRAAVDDLVRPERLEGPFRPPAGPDQRPGGDGPATRPS